ncbi:hypothetical protein ACFL6Y_10165 [Elusimicrobiota bacterium]
MKKLLILIMAVLLCPFAVRADGSAGDSWAIGNSGYRLDKNTFGNAQLDDGTEVSYVSQCEKSCSSCNPTTDSTGEKDPLAECVHQCEIGKKDDSCKQIDSAGIDRLDNWDDEDETREHTDVSIGEANGGSYALCAIMETIEYYSDDPDAETMYENISDVFDWVRVMLPLEGDFTSCINNNRGKAYASAGTNIYLCKKTYNSSYKQNKVRVLAGIYIHEAVHVARFAADVKEEERIANALSRNALAIAAKRCNEDE